MPQEIVRALAATPLCSGLDDDELHRLAGEGRVEHWAEGAVVMEEGAVGPRLVVLLSGEVEVLKRDGDGAERVLARVGPGAVLGEMSLLLESPRTATVRAVSPLRVFAMDHTAFQAMVADGDPAALKLAHRIARVLAARVEALNQRVIELLSERHREPLDEFAKIRQQLFTRWDF